jgi:MFS family permease
MVLPNRQQIRLLLPLGTAVALSLAGDSTLYAVLANQTELLGISLAGVGALLGVNRLIRIPGNPLAGVLHDRWGRRRLFLLGLLLGIVSTFGYSLVRGFWPLFAARLLWGTAWALINVGGYTMVLDRSTPADRGRMTGFYQVSYMLGLAISPILGGALTDVLGFRPAVRICAAISGIGLVVALAALPETRPPAGGSQSGGISAVPRWSLPELVGVLRRVDRRILLAGYIYLVTFFVSNGVLMSTISLYLGQRWGESISLNGVAIGVSSLAGLLLALRALLGIVAGPAAGILSDRLGDRWPVARGGILLGVSGFLILSLLPSIWAVPGGVVLVSLSAGSLIAVLAALVGDLAANDRPGITMGGLATAGDIGSATGPLLAYALATILDLRQIYLLCAVALASGLLATVGMKGNG